VTNQGGGGAIWRSDGTRQGSAEQFALPATTFGVERLALANGDFYLVLDNAQGGSDVWKSDGTAGGTLPLTDFGRQGQVADQDFVVVRNVEAVRAQRESARRVLIRACDSSPPLPSGRP
jgi:ELWxxDGT repeat protein